MVRATVHSLCFHTLGCNRQGEMIIDEGQYWMVRSSKSLAGRAVQQNRSVDVTVAAGEARKPERQTDRQTGRGEAAVHTGPHNDTEMLCLIVC